MRESKNRHVQDLRRLNLARQLIEHPVRSGSIYAITGLTPSQVPKLVHPCRKPSVRRCRRELAPTSCQMVFHQARARDAYARAGLSTLFGFVLETPVHGPRQPLPGVGLNERLCEVSDPFGLLIGKPASRVEQFLLLVISLAADRCGDDAWERDRQDIQAGDRRSAYALLNGGWRAVAEGLPLALPRNGRADPRACGHRWCSFPRHLPRRAAQRISPGGDSRSYGRGISCTRACSLGPSESGPASAAGRRPRFPVHCRCDWPARRTGRNDLSFATRVLKDAQRQPIQASDTDAHPSPQQAHWVVDAGRIFRHRNGSGRRLRFTIICDAITCQEKGDLPGQRAHVARILQ